MLKKLIFILIGVFISSCVQDPIQKLDDDVWIDSKSAVIICEGLYGYNNASATVFSMLTGKVNQQIFKQVNRFDLGDIANSSIILDSSLYVIVSTSRVLYKISLKNFKVQQVLSFPANTYPRQIISNDGYFFVSDAYTNKVYKIKQSNLEIADSIVVGAQPEGMCVLYNYLYVVNSGWGDINSSHSEANTIYQINLGDLQIIQKVKTFPNPVEIIADSINKKIYVTYYNLPSQKDSVGGILEYDENLLLKKQFKGNFLKTKIINNKKLLSLIDNNPSSGKNQKPGLALIDLINNSTNTILKNNIKVEFWYNFLFDPDNQQIWICNAMDFQSNGKIEIYNTNFLFTKMEFLKSFYTGLNPNQILLCK